MGWLKKLLGGDAEPLFLCPKCGTGLTVPCLPDMVACPKCQTQYGCEFGVGRAPENKWTKKLALCLRCGGNLLPFDDVDIAQKAYDEVEEKKTFSDPSTAGTIWRSKWVWTKCAKCGETKKVPVSRPRS